MFKFLSKCVNYFIPEKLRVESHIYYRALAFVSLTLFLLVAILAMDLTIRVLSLENEPNLVLCMIFLSSVLVATKKYGSMQLSGNMLALFNFLILATSVPASGGLYSDNLIWLILSPMIALLFSNKLSGFSWLLVLLGFTVYQYATFNVNDFASFKLSNSTYYFVSYFSLFIFIYGIIIIFERGQELVIKMLVTQKEKLRQQKREISKKNKELKLAEERLLQSNTELENFAFIASHDMREPLRMIGMYTQLTQKKLRDNSDKSTTEYLGYVTDGVGRLQNLLEDLLNYSRLGKDVSMHKPLDLNNTLYAVMHNLMANLKDSNASIISDHMPTIHACSSEMNQLFQNILANAIKFRKKDVAPEILIRSFEKDDCYEFSIKDNGIGIKCSDQDRVFNIFEKLHSKSQYEGSGIGLATCRKIVENLGGRIWLTSEEGLGTTFHFTIHKDKIAKNIELQKENIELQKELAEA
jgi:signal transduction histidine kinase